MGEKIAFLEIVPRIKTKTYSPGSAAEEECLLATIRVLDEHCAGWYLAVNHDEKIGLFRRPHYSVFAQPNIIAMTPEAAVLFKLFKPDDCTIINETVRPRVPYMARMAAGSTVNWKGPLKDFPAELLSATAREHLDRETSTALLNGRKMFELPIGFAGSWPCWN